MTIETGHYDFTIYQGATFGRVFTWKDQSNTLINLTGYTARMQFRASHDADTPFLSLTLGSGISLGGATGTITLAISDSITAAITETSGVYDLELISAGGIVTRLLQGRVVIDREVTR